MLTITPTFEAEVVVAEGAVVLDGPAGPLGNWLVACPRGHRFRVSRAPRRRNR